MLGASVGGDFVQCWGLVLEGDCVQCWGLVLEVTVCSAGMV